MARRTITATRSPSVVVVPQSAAPIRRRSSGGGGKRRRSAPRRRARSSGGGGGSMQNRMIGHAVGGFAVGFLEKSFPQLPTLPIVGKKGAIAIAAYMLRGQSPILGDVALAAAAISGYELGSRGTITGEDVVGGLAAQM